MGMIGFPTIDELCAQASAACGLHDFGSGFEEALGVLRAAIVEDIALSADNVPRIAGPIVALLVSRAYSEAGWKRHPRCLAQTIRAPLVVTGLPRTGTTALHKLMAVDQRFQGLQTWLLDSPMPRPPRETWTDYPAFHRTAATLEARFKAAPKKRAAHNMAAEEVDECCLVLRQGFVSNLWTVGWSAATYDAWWQCQSEESSYRHYYRCLQLIGSTEPDKRWLL